MSMFRRFLKVPGVLSAKRYQALEGSPKYLAVYEIESADVVTSDAWVAAADSGRWPTEIRPFCTEPEPHSLQGDGRRGGLVPSTQQRQAIR